MSMQGQGVCAKCGFVFLLDYGLECPNCRMIAVQTTFRPRNPEDYAKLDFLRSKLAEQGVRWHGEDMRGTIYESEPDEAKYRIPKGEANQIYELRRLFRL